MTLSIQNPYHTASSTSSPPTAKAEIEKMLGILWYDMLSCLNQAGMDENTLGTGGSDFQSMFLWNVAENDFNGYDANLMKAALHQVGGTSSLLAARLPEQSMAENFLANKKVIELPVEQTSLTSLEVSPSSSSDLLLQAESFTKSIWPEIILAAKKLGVPAVAILAQTALETGWGAAAPGHNLFGIKAVDGQDGSKRATHEALDGVLTAQTANFRNYSSSTESISDYVSLIKTLYPDAINQSSIMGFAQALQTGGYATDQNYAGKIEQIARSPIMYQVLQSVSMSQSQVVETQP